MTYETHRHCQCDYCSGEDCGKDDPERFEAERIKEQKEHDQQICNQILDAYEHDLWVELQSCGVSREVFEGIALNIRKNIGDIKS